MVWAGGSSTRFTGAAEEKNWDSMVLGLSMPSVSRDDVIGEQWGGNLDYPAARSYAWKSQLPHHLSPGRGWTDRMDGQAGEGERRQ